jgi:DNA-directed RNA polymerase II subunit RPB2
MDSDIVTVDPIVRRVEALELADASIPGKIAVDEQGRLLKTYLEFDGITAPLIEAYDQWITRILPEQISSKTITIPEGTVSFERLFITKPGISIGDEVRPLYPQRCRNAGLTYSANLAVDIVLHPNNGGPQQRLEKIPLGKIPVMLFSSLCHLNGLSDEELLRVAECPRDPGGYFIIKGIERLCLIQEKLRLNRIFVFNGDTKGNVVCRMTCPSPNGTTIVNLSIGKKRGIKLSLHFMGKDTKGNNHSIGVFQAFRLIALKYPETLGALADPNVMLSLVSQHIKPDTVKRVWTVLQPSFFKLQEVGDDIEHLAIKKKITSLPQEEKTKTILDSLEHELFPQMNNEPTLRKVQMLSAMVARLAEFMAGLRTLDDRDSWSNKRLETSSRSMEQLFSGLFNKAVTQCQETITEKKLKGLDSVRRSLSPAIITDEFIQSFNSNNWGVKGSYFKENITDILKRDNQLATISHLLRVNTPTSRQAKQPNIRLVQMSQLGYICPAETPEGEGCGLLKNLAITCYISIERDELPIRQAIEPYLTADPTPQSTTRCWLNGKLIGFCPGKALKDWCIHQRRSGRFYKDICVVLDSDNLYIFCDGARPTRPLLIVNQETGQLVIKEKNLWLADMPTLLSEGCVEYIDAWEQEEIMLAQSIAAMEAKQNEINRAKEILAEAQELMKRDEPIVVRTATGEEQISKSQLEQRINQTKDVLERLTRSRWFTHCEIDPSAYLGHSASVIPLPNHNQAPRNTYQCSMGKQALGIYHSNQHQRFDNMTKTLAFPSQPLFEPQLNEVMGINDLPSGETAIVAVMTYMGYNQEDAFIFNRASIERGMFRMIKHITYKAVQKQTRDVTEYFARPEVRKGEPAGRYANIDENGLIRVGAHVKQGDCVIGKVRRNNILNTIENASVFAGVGEEGIVERVLVTPNAENMLVVKVKIRSIRDPIVGDKFASRSAQKGTIGIILNEEDMPFTAQGIKPDIIINPHCFVGSTPVTLQNGLSRRIDAMPLEGGENVWGWDSEKDRLTPSRQIEMDPKGKKNIIQLTLMDGRILKCTPDHRFLVIKDTQPEWVEAQDIELQRDRLLLGFEGVLDEPQPDEASYILNGMSMDSHRDLVLAYARLTGLSYTEDIPKLLKTNSLYSKGVAVDVALFEQEWTPKGHNEDFPQFILDPQCPKSVVREFLAGMFSGKESRSPRCIERNGIEEKTTIFSGVSLRVWTMERCSQIYDLMSRFGISLDYEESYTKDGAYHLLLITPKDTKFSELIGLRYNVSKQIRLSVATSYWRYLENTRRQHDEVNNRALELYNNKDSRVILGGKRFLHLALDIAREELIEREAVINKHYSLSNITALVRKRDSKQNKKYNFDHRCIYSAKAYLDIIASEDYYITMVAIDRRDAGVAEVYDISVAGAESFLACGVVVHNCIPSRMTLGKVIEIVTSKLSALKGERMNATAHRAFDLQGLQEGLVQYGYQQNGNETMYSGMTGKQFQAQIYIGPCYYQALRHHVLDKIQARARGAIKPLTHQPVGGRTTDGGSSLRFGEMDRDAIISWGASDFLKERLCGVSDAYKTVWCQTCGTIAIANHVTKQYVCRKCSDRGNFGTVTIPYVFKLLTHLLNAAGLDMRLDMKELNQEESAENVPSIPDMTVIPG